MAQSVALYAMIGAALVIGALGAAMGVAADVVTIQNAAVAFQVDLLHGCSISAAWAVGDPSHTNLINTADLGRYVQASYYAGPSGYAGCAWRGNPWPWNPISAGDVHGNPAKVLNSSHTATSASCTIVPMQWACNNIACDCTIDFKYALEGNMLMATVTLHNNRPDHKDYGADAQEIPAVYVNAFLDQLYGYKGDKPCTGDAPTPIASGWSTSGGDPWVPGTMSDLTEPFLAFTQSNSFGLGVWSDSAKSYKAGFFGTKGAGGTHDGPTGYIAPLGTADLLWNTTYSYRYALIMGNLPDIRAAACKLGGY